MSSRFDPDFGTIEFIRSSRARYINVRVLQDGLRVSLPPRTTEKEAMDFIHSVRSTIIKKREKIKADREKNSLMLDENTPLRTQAFSVELKPAARENIFLSLKNNVLSIEYPQGTDCRNEAVQSRFWDGINFFLKQEAKRILPARTKFLADKHGFSFSSVKIQSSKSRWGSCSQGENINLSFYLMLLPLHLADYVILHELCHTKEMNHSPRFWRLMDKVTDGQSSKLREEVKKFHIPK